jgi:FMN phosphatase YigB (HAD superfamily)
MASSSHRTTTAGVLELSSCRRFANTPKPDLRDPVDALLREYRVMTLDGFPPIDAQIHEKLQALRETGWSIAVVTNGEDGVQQATIEQIGLSHLIDACVVSGAVGIRKPDARIFEIA